MDPTLVWGVFSMCFALWCFRLAWRVFAAVDKIYVRRTVAQLVGHHENATVYMIVCGLIFLTGVAALFVSLRHLEELWDK